ncbi:chromo domain-containing protein [Colletotrichum acutatum]
MSVPLVFKGREVAMTQNELAASSAAAKANGDENEDEDDLIPKIESDLVEPADAPEKSASRKRQCSQPATSKASKRRKLLEGQEPLAGSAQSARASIENRVAPAAKKGLPLDASDSDEGDGPDDHGPSDTERDDASPPPVQAPKKRGRPRKTTKAVSTKSKKLTGKPIPAGPVTKEKAVTEKKAVTTYGRGVARPRKATKKSPVKGTSTSPTYSEEFYVVEKIVGARVDPETKVQMYMVKWKGYGSNQNTWEPKGNLSKCAGLIKSFNTSQKNEKGKK